MDAHAKAMTNRSIRTIKTELEFLVDSSLLSSAQLHAILALLPKTGLSHEIPITQLAATTISEKQSPSYYQPTQSPVPTPAPPAYAAQATSLATATAIYAYNPTDAGDLALLPRDRVTITEFMNADWAKGRNERSGQEGIFPRSYVNVIEDKSGSTMSLPPQKSGSSYGNLPLMVSQSGGSSNPGGPPSKTEENGKKFGKKLGNAAIFGAGASIGGKIVNGIF